MRFKRYGELKRKKQLGYKDNSDESLSFSPPARYGFYAFPVVKGFPPNLFLLNSNLYNPERHVLLKDENGQLIKYGHKLYDEYEKKSRKYFKYKVVYVNNHCKDIAIDNLSKMSAHWYYEDIVEKYGDKKSYGEIYDTWKKNFHIAIYKKPRYFDYVGNIWSHHKPEKDSDVIEKYQDWYKYNIDGYKKALQKAIDLSSKEGIFKDNSLINEVFIE